MPAKSKTMSAAARPPASAISGACRTVAAAGLRWLGGADVLRSLSCSHRLREWAQDVRPDLIYTQLSSLGMIRLVTQLADGLGLPIAVHIMDDWASVIYDRGLLGRHLRSKTDRSFRALVARASATLAISQRMADVYRLRYGREWEVFHNPVDIAKWASTRRQDWSRHGAFKLVYAGRVGQGIESSLVDVCRAVEELRRRALDLRLDIFTPSQSAAASLLLASFDGVAVHDAIEDERMPKELAAADLLVLPFDFFGKAAKFACLSYPTKAPAYMATGVPCLVYAPRDHALTQDARAKGWACVVDSPGADGLIAAIRELASNEPLRKDLAQRAVTTSESLHDARVVRKRFRAALARAGGQTLQTD
jgi:glycosyltransferase involved in cell wall biosynthesis